MERQDWKCVAEDLKKAIAEVGAKHDVLFTLKNWRFDETYCKYNLSANVLKVGTKKFDPRKKEFEDYAFRFGLKKSDFGKVVSLRGMEFKLCGLRPRARSYPLIGKETQTGKEYKLPEQEVCEQLRRGI